MVPSKGRESGEREEGKGFGGGTGFFAFSSFWGFGLLGVREMRREWIRDVFDLFLGSGFLGGGGSVGIPECRS